MVQWQRIWFHLSYMDFVSQDLLLHHLNSCCIQKPIFQLLCHSFVVFNLPLEHTFRKCIAQQQLHSFFFIRTSKFCLRLAVLIFFIFEAEMFLICSYFPNWTLQCHKECQTEYNKNTLFHFFHSLSFKQRT